MEKNRLSKLGKMYMIIISPFCLILTSCFYRIQKAIQRPLVAFKKHFVPIQMTYDAGKDWLKPTLEPVVLSLLCVHLNVPQNWIQHRYMPTANTPMYYKRWANWTKPFWDSSTHLS